MDAELVHSLLQSFCISTATVAVFLIAIQLRTSFDKSLIYFGTVLLLLCAFAAADIWGGATNTKPSLIVLQHVIISFVPPCALHYLQLVARQQKTRQVHILLSSALAVSVLLLSAPLLETRNDTVTPTFWYYLSFFPFLVVSVGVLIAWVLSNLNKADKSLKKLLIVHLIGFLFLTFSGALDLYQLFRGKHFTASVASYAIIGTVGLGLVFAYFFTERLITIIRERMVFTERLQESYRELEQARGLSEIGRSTAIINHEIKNYTCVISGYGQYLLQRADLKEPFTEMVNRIIETATKLTTFSNEILDFSKAKILKDKQPLSIGPLVQKCIETHWPDKLDQITLSGVHPDNHIHGEWRKLERVFVNLIRNAFEAKATDIDIRFIPRDYVLLVAIEDNGVGCGAEECSHLFEAFRTTKDNGTGLGLPTSRAIIEAHGGRISALSKNTLGEGQHGVIFNIVFPTYAAPTGHKDDIVFIKNSLGNLAEVIRVFQNVFVSPHVIESADELTTDNFIPQNCRVVAAPEVVADIVSRNLGYQCYSVVKSDDGIPRVVGSPPDRFEGLFSEEFILEKLLRKAG